MQHLVRVLGGTDGDLFNFVVGHDVANKYSAARKAIIGSYIAGIEHPHYSETYYVIAKVIQ